MTGAFPPLRYRQIHLDFHTSEAIRDIGEKFDANTFVQTLVEASVDSVTLFARCHHGWAYYPSDVGPSHPHLARADLLGEMVDACRKHDIETPIYITVQWDEYLARTRPELRVMSANNKPHHISDDPSTSSQLTATWHTLCLAHERLRDYVLETAREVIDRYNPPGLFFDIVNGYDCVCPKCLEIMRKSGLDPVSPADRDQKDRQLIEAFRNAVSSEIWVDHPNVRIFFNSGHISKRDRASLSAFSHLEIESLPTGGWGWDHFPVNARYAVPAGFDTLGQTGKFHISWGEFGGFKSGDSLAYECAQMVALGAKCLIGDQLHPNGRINADTYKSIAPAYARIKALEPWLKGAEQIAEVGILSREHFSPDASGRNSISDEGAAQMCLELHLNFDFIDEASDFSRYPLLVLPDNIPLSNGLGERLNEYLATGGRILASGTSGLGQAGGFQLPLGVSDLGEDAPFNPSYARACGSVDRLPSSPFVVYAPARKVELAGGVTICDAIQPYANRSWDRFSSHQHFPDDPSADPIGPGIVTTPQTGYVAWPIFETYKKFGQPLYKHSVEALINHLLPRRLIETSLPSGGRATLTRQSNRTILHLLFGGPQVRGVAVDDLKHPLRPIEIIEDIPELGPISVSVALDTKPNRVVSGPDNTPIEWTWEDGRAVFTLNGLHIHRAIAFEEQ